jgi:hypothetical protein
MLPDDVVRFFERRFPASDRVEARALLEGARLHDGSTPGPRLLRCAAVASHGSLERLRMEVETLKHDYRDVIVEGEYVPQGCELKKVRDLNAPIGDEV